MVPEVVVQPDDDLKPVHRTVNCGPTFSIKTTHTNYFQLARQNNFSLIITVNISDVSDHELVSGSFQTFKSAFLKFMQTYPGEVLPSFAICTPDFFYIMP